MVVLRSRFAQKNWVVEARRLLSEFGVDSRWEKSSRSEVVFVSAGLTLTVPEKKSELQKIRGLSVGVGSGVNAALWVAAFLVPKKVRTFRKALTQNVLANKNVTSALRR